MERIELKKLKDCKSYIGQTPKKEHYKKLITTDTIFYKNNKIVGFYKKLNEKEIVAANILSLTTKINKSHRQGSGTPTLSSVFGALPRNGIRNNKCSSAQRNKTEEKNFKRIILIAKKLAEQYKKIMPEQYKKDLEYTKSLVNEEYFIKNMPFTTYNANVNQIIRYHTDSGNLKGVYSNVLISKKNAEGGYLVFPEYEIALEQANGFMSVFNGQEEVHGVTDCKILKENSYRTSFVFYTLEQMKHCLPYKEELELFYKKETKRNENRAATFGMSKEEFKKRKFKK